MTLIKALRSSLDGKHKYELSDDYKDFLTAFSDPLPDDDIANSTVGDDDDVANSTVAVPKKKHKKHKLEWKTTNL